MKKGLIHKTIKYLLGSVIGCIALTLPANAIPFSPRVKRFTTGDYAGGNQNWSVSQGEDDIMYFGNNQGLLRYDGVRWDLFKLPANKTVRSVHAASDGRIYAGGFEEFGYFEKDESNRLIYHSLSDSLPFSALQNKEVWRILPIGEKVLFQTFSNYFTYDGKNTYEKSELSSMLYIYPVDENIYAQTSDGELYKYNGTKFESFLSKESVKSDDVIALFRHPKGGLINGQFEDRMLLITAHNGIFYYDNGTITPFPTQADEALKSAVANRATRTHDSLFVVGTLSDGAFAFNWKGELVWHINKRKQLPNNTVLGIWCTPDNNLWCALDNGIALVRNNSPLRFYTPEEPDLGMIYDIALKNNAFYYASNHGLYYQPFQNKAPVMIDNINSQTWHITNIDGQLICGYNHGTLALEGNKSTVLQNNTGTTSIAKAVLHGKEILLQSSYWNLILFKKGADGKWQYSHNIEDFAHPIRNLEVDPAGNIWASQMHKGIYRITLTEDLKSVDELEYYPRLDNDSSNVPTNIHIMKLRGRTIFSDGKQFYIYEDLQHLIQPFEKLNNDLPDIADTYRIISVNNDLYWFIRNTEYLLVRHQKGTFHIQTRIPFSSFENPSIEREGNIYIGDKGESYFCLDGGIAKYNSTAPIEWRKPQLTFSGIEVDETNENGERTSSYLPLDKEAKLKITQNSLIFRLSYPDYNGDNFRIRYTLKRGNQPEEISQNNFWRKTYNNLPPGSYLFSATAENNVGKTIGTLTYRFSIAPPLYLSWKAFLGYFAVALLLIWGVVRFIISRTMRNRERLFSLEQERQQRKLNEQEKLITELQKKRLESELSFKGKELASIAMEAINRKEFLEDLRKELQNQITGPSISRKTLERLVGEINEQASSDTEWSLFQENFDLIHEKFFRKLKESFPELTSGDLRFCALLRLNMSTKEMARMSNLSVRGIEAARYRLRKKLDVPDGKSLVEFMIEFK